MNITKEQKILLYLTARSISDQPSSLACPKINFENICWQDVYLESKQQTVALATFDALSEEKKYMPKEVYSQWMMTATAKMQSNFAVLQAQADLVNLLDENALPYIILKGTTAAAYYPKGELRTLGDVDFLIDPTRQTETEEILLAAGYQKNHGDHPNHVVFKKPNAHLEMHFEVAGVPYGEIGEKVRQFLKNAVFSPVEKQWELTRFQAPQDMYHGLILLLHMQHHLLGEGLGLRHLCDWAVYVKRTYEQDFWKETLLPFFKKIGLFQFAATITKVCAKFLAIPCPAWAEQVGETLCDLVLEDVLASGNFGRKDEQRSKGGEFISQHGKDGTNHGRAYHLFRVLHKETYNKAVRKCPLLYPFVFVWRLLWHFGRTITGKSKPFKVLNAAKQRKSIYDQLKVFEIENKEK